MAHCIYIPTIKSSDGTQIESQLFKDLQQHTGDRQMSKVLWGLTQVKSIMDSLEGIQYDQNGEVTIESLDLVFDINSLAEGPTSLISERKKLGALDRQGEPILHDSSEQITQKVIDFNKANPDLVATVDKVGDKYSMNVEYKDHSNVKVPGDVEFQSALNNQLKGTLRSLGFDVTQLNSENFDGIFTPQSGKQTADGLRSIIEVVEGRKGELAFSEEFSHFMIEGLRHTPLVERTIQNLKNESVLREVLGDSYDTYSELYEGDLTRLAKEAAGQLLDMHIKNPNLVPSSRKNLIGRLWNNIKNFFKKLTNQHIDTAIENAHKNVSQIAESIRDDSFMPLFREENLLDAQELYKVTEDLVNMKSLADQALRLASKKLSIETIRTKSREVDDVKLASIENQKRLVQNKQYASSTIHFMQDVINDLTNINHLIEAPLKSKEYKESARIKQLGDVAKVLRNISEYRDAYKPIIEQLQAAETLLENGDVNLTPEDAKIISDMATQISRIMSNMDMNYKNMRMDVIFNFLGEFWGGDKILEIGSNKGKALELEMMIKMGEQDIGGWDRMISSLADASDPLLSLVDKIFKETERKRDVQLEKIVYEIRAEQKILHERGYNSKFMYERDADGNLTGRIISDIDYIRFKKDRKDYMNSLKERGFDQNSIYGRMVAWDTRNMEAVEGDTLDNKRVERRPKKSIYGTNTLSKLSPAQKRYYDFMIATKEAIDIMLPSGYTSIHNAIHVRSDFVEAISQHAGNVKTLARVVGEQIRDNVFDTEHDTEFGQLTDSEGNLYDPIDRRTEKTVMTDFSGEEIQQVPIYFTRPLRNLDRMSTDFAGSMMAYAAMATRYNELSKIVDIMEVFRDSFYEREIKKKSGSKQLIDSFRLAGEQYKKDHTFKGKETNAVRRLDEYLAANLYGQRKLYQGTFKLPGLKNHEVNKAKLADTIRNYTTHVALGINVFSGIGNVSIGKMQMFLESMGGEHYKFRDTVASEKLYWELLPSAINESNSVTKSNKLDLLIDKFNAMDNYGDSVGRQNYHKNVFARMLGNKGSMLFMAEAGEHYVRSKNMLSHLNAFKVKDRNGKKIPLHKAFEVDVEIREGVQVGGKLKIKDGVTNLDGSKITEKQLSQLRNKIMRTSKYITVNVNPMDRAAVQRNMWGRLAMQFRGWIPAHFNRRFGKAQYDNLLEQEIEGFYKTTARVAWEVAKDFRKFKFNVATHWHGLTKHEQANLRRAGTEFGTFMLLGGLVFLGAGVKDKKSAWFEKMMLYQAHRLRLQIGAFMPLHTGIVTNAWDILQSPMAAMSGTEDLANLLKFWNLFDTIEGGRYKGKNKYMIDAYRSMPYLPQFHKAVDLNNDSYMFNIFN